MITQPKTDGNTKKSFKNQISGQIGESIVVDELGRQGVVATAFSGNVPDIDLLAYYNGMSIPIQVKAQSKGDLSVNAKHYLDIIFDGKKQIVKDKTKNFHEVKKSKKFKQTKAMIHNELNRRCYNSPIINKPPY